MRRILFSILTLFTILSAPAFAQGFGFDDVIAKAKALAAKPYKAPDQIPKFMTDLSFNQYNNIRFNPDQSLWRDSHSRFQVTMVSPGLYYTHPVQINVVNSEGVHPLNYDKSNFSYPSDDLEKRVPPDLGYAGFKLTYPLVKGNTQTPFLVFAGASYFQGIGKPNVFGSSARGVAIDTGLPTGEQFPSFVEYWLVRPVPDAHAMLFYALLDGKSVTGAYQFTVYPGNRTLLRVRAVLIPRQSVKLMGVAPLTSMFYYGENTPRPKGEWRRQVHDADGLLIHNGGSNEWLWRPLINPKSLQIDYFSTQNLRGFGLMQRHTDFSDYQDLGARYDRRPSIWVEPQEDWGNGNVVLVQLPTDKESNDNIAAFWSPTKAWPAKQPVTLNYNLSFGDPGVSGETMAHATNTFIGAGHRADGGDAKGTYRVLVDFTGGPLDNLRPNASVVGRVSALDGGQILEQFPEYVPPIHGWRLSILAKPADGKPLNLRAYLAKGDQTLSETWSYFLPDNNDVLPGSE